MFFLFQVFETQKLRIKAGNLQTRVVPNRICHCAKITMLIIQ